MNFDIAEYTLLQHWLPALINGDLSGLTDEEAVQIKEFEGGIVTKYGAGHWSWETDCSHFQKCELCGLMGDCCDVLYFYSVKRGRKESDHKRICKQHGTEMVEYRRKNGTRFFQCRECEAIKQIVMNYRKLTGDQIMERLEQAATGFSHALIAAERVLEERKQKG